MEQKIIARGAEAVIKKQGNNIQKFRVEKGYRLPILDEKIRRLRTKREIKIIEKLSKVIPVPKIIETSTHQMTMSYIPGKKLSEHLEKLQKISKKIGENLAKMHDIGIIHGDLTTSNMIYNEKEKKLYFIDFGLSFHSDKIEDKAVDLHLIKEALEAKHPKIFKKAFKQVLKGYEKSTNSEKVLKQLEKVEKRGRYKAQF